MATYDVVIGGSGINGLSAAAYLAKAGLSVCVVEGRDFIGGGVICEEHPEAPGVIHDAASAAHVLIQWNPMLQNDELGLKSKYGLRYTMAEGVGTHFCHKEGFAFTMWKDYERTLKEIEEKLGAKEAENYAKMTEYFAPLIPMLVFGMFNPPADAATQNAAFAALGEKGAEMARMSMMSGWDITCEWLETDVMRETVARLMSESMISPYAAGTGSSFVACCALLHQIGIPVAVGGSSKLSEKLAECIIDNGGVIRTGAYVKGVKVVGGKAKAFVLEDGEEIEASRALLSTFHVKQLFGEDGMVEQDLLSDSFKRSTKRLRESEYVPMLQSITLKAEPKFKLLDGQASPSITNEQSEGLHAFRRLFNGMSEGEPSAAKTSMAFLPSAVDRSRAGDTDYHTLYLYNYEPYALYGDGKNWDIHGQHLADEALEAFFDLTTNLSESDIVSRRVRNPLDFERFNRSWLKGDFCHLSQAMDQGQSNRPFAALSNYRTPIDGLYLGGASVWPGPTVIGGGRAVAQVIFQDLGINFDDAIVR